MKLESQIKQAANLTELRRLSYKDHHRTPKSVLSYIIELEECYEKLTRPKKCTNCGCPEPKKTAEGYWCKMCKNEM